MVDGSAPRDHRGRRIEFGRTADDYDRHRPGFPDSFFERLTRRGWIAAGRRALDLGAGTGALALGLARRGLEVVALDPSRELLAVARRRAEELGVGLGTVCGYAEDTREPSGIFDLVSAGQCWWWFDADAVVAESRRLLVTGGRLLIANFSYLPLPGSVAAQSEKLILEHNPGWPKAGESGVFEDQVRALDRGGFDNVESFSYLEPVRFTHEAWRGRMRACNGVGAALDTAEVEAFDRDLAAMLEENFQGELVIPHRVFVATGVRPNQVDAAAARRSG